PARAHAAGERADGGGGPAAAAGGTARPGRRAGAAQLPAGPARGPARAAEEPAGVGGGAARRHAGRAGGRTAGVRHHDRPHGPAAPPARPGTPPRSPRPEGVQRVRGVTPAALQSRWISGAAAAQSPVDAWRSCRISLLVGVDADRLADFGARPVIRLTV